MKTWPVCCSSRYLPLHCAALLCSLVELFCPLAPKNVTADPRVMMDEVICSKRELALPIS